jgi:hypothetical protein
LQADGGAGRRLDVVAHEALVDGADLLDVEGAVGEALAFEEEEALEDLVDGAVVDARGPARRRGLGSRSGGGAARPPAFEEGVERRGRRGGRGGGEVELAVARPPRMARKSRERRGQAPKRRFIASG